MFQFASQLRIKFMQLRRYFFQMTWKSRYFIRINNLRPVDPHAVGVKNEKNSLIDNSLCFEDCFI